MKFSIDPADLKEAVRFAQTAIAGRPTSPIMSAVLLEVQPHELRASGSDYLRYSRVAVPVDVEQSGQALLYGQMLGLAVNKFKSKKPVTVRVESDRAYLSQGSMKFEMPIMPANEYPKNLNGNPEDIGTINGNDFSTLIHALEGCASTDEALPVLKSIHLELGERIDAMATDRYKIGTDYTNWEPNAEMKISATVSTDWLKNISKTIAGETTLHISMDGGEPSRIGVTSGPYTSSISLLSGDYPKVRALFTNASTDTHTIDRKELIDAVDAVSVMAERNTPVRLTAKDSMIVLDAGGGDNAASVAIETDSYEEFILAFNPSFLLTVLRSIDTDQVKLSPAGAKPATIEPGDGSSRYLLMPIRLPNQ
ncbi:DNA polymerase III subunit beta [Glutamicibacter sp. BW77]|uniref:DNA polymerase III subunit beta n=1 Tax=Glutamicibacter sp. BW77 TaxID=2024402 RepID=UPI000BB6CE1C|nr:DNA polymerase III subunit beta [Glutamicibacter sp. BW77]PCC31422.1 DNA polymerase III subunit beta [Glutamicibacter sp. BW77]